MQTGTGRPGSRHPVLENDAGGTTGLGNGLASAVRAGDEVALGGGHRYVEAAPVEQERSGDAHGKLHVPDRQLAALAQDARSRTRRAGARPYPFW
jgi:hypothetical protein